MQYLRAILRSRISASLAGLSIAALALAAAARTSQAALIDGGDGPQLLIGTDDDRQDNADVQAGAATDQSLKRTDVLIGGRGNDVIFGLNGNDVIDGGQGQDIILGGPDGGPAPGGPPNSDIMFGGQGNDVNLWAPGDGSEAFIGGPGLDALIFGITDRENGSVKLLQGVPGFPQGVPTANVSGQPNFCTVEASPLPGYDQLIRFRNQAGNLIVTVRVRDVEQVFCSQDGGITFADLTQPAPGFVNVSPSEVVALNPLIGAMIR